LRSGTVRRRITSLHRPAGESDGGWKRATPARRPRAEKGEHLRAPCQMPATEALRRARKRSLSTARHRGPAVRPRAEHLPGRVRRERGRAVPRGAAG